MSGEIKPTILELDIGNSRAKWRCLEAPSSMAGPGQDNVSASCSPQEILKNLEQQWLTLLGAEVQSIRISSVREPAFNAEISKGLFKMWQVEPQFARVQGQCGGVTNAYHDIENLGIDRWLAILAAYKDAGGACGIIDCGSAITIDLVNDLGQHLGGYIVPGLSLMQTSLKAKSDVLESGRGNWAETTPGTDTGAAIRNGLLKMVVGLVEQVRLENDKDGDYSWYLTGGDAALLAPLLSGLVQLMPDLVMDGLAIALKPDANKKHERA